MEESIMEGKRRKDKDLSKNVNEVNKVLSTILKINIVIIIALLICVTILYFLVNDKSKFTTLNIEKSINSLNDFDIEKMYKITKIETENEGINTAINGKVLKYITSQFDDTTTDYTKVSNALNYIELSNEYKENSVNKFTNSYVCKINIKKNLEEKYYKLFFNYNLRNNSQVVIDNIINKDKLNDFKDELKEKYNLDSPDLENFLLTKEYIEIYNTDFKNSAKIKYDDIEDYLVNQVLTSDNITNYYTIFKGAIDPTKPMLALTFDDGPYDLTTERILNTLTQYNSKATFFVLGTRVDYYPDTIRKIVAQGSQIGNHTKNHLNLVQQPISTVEYEINYVKTRVKEVAAYDVTVLRPPYGNRNDTVRSIANCPLILWCVDTEDWKSRNAQSVYNEILKYAFDGSIILMHDIYDSTASAVAMAVPELIRRGFQLVTIDELYYYKGKDKVPGEVVYSIK